MNPTMTLVEKTVFLKSLDMLAAIPTEALAQLAASAVEQHVGTGEALFQEGEVDHDTFIVVEGRVELRKDNIVVGVLHAGSAHGEFFIEDGQGHQYRGVALEETHLLNIRRDDVVSVLLDFPEFGLAMVRAHAIGVQRLTERVIHLEAQLKRYAEALERAGIPIPDSPSSDGAKR